MAGLLTWQVRAIIRSDVPRLRAIQAVTTGITRLLVLYASMYSVIAYNQPDSFTEPLSRAGPIASISPPPSSPRSGSATSRHGPSSPGS
jgi:hypothetical protein